MFGFSRKYWILVSTASILELPDTLVTVEFLVMKGLIFADIRLELTENRAVLV